MSRHVSRRERWEKFGGDAHRSIDGLVARRYKGEWWADVAYSLFVAGGEGEVMEWRPHFDRLGPFKRPRNAMVEAERHATALRNRHGERVRFEDAASGPRG
jgi:hypothetical protein